MSATGLMGAGLALAIVIGAAGCKQNPTVAAQDNTGADPADANMAPVNGHAQVLDVQQQGQPTQQGTDYPQQAPAPVVRQAPSGDAGQQSYAPGDDSYNTDVDNGQAALEEADQAPPPLPQYDQPPAPEPDDLWTPGYWGWANNDYYWVPGVWVSAPYPGALWTPGYWGYYHNRYRFYHGYWGLHIGFYGGINYGFGYVGTGFYGGYWNANHFYYNSAVTRVNVNVIHNVYQRPVSINVSNTRVSFNGGNGGVAVRPRPAEIAAMHEHHTPAMAAQVQNQQQAAQNRAQFFNQNHGRPAMAVAPRSLPADRNIAPPARVAPRSGAIPAIQQQPRGPVQPQQRTQEQPRPQPQQNQQQLQRNLQQQRIQPQGQIQQQVRPQNAAPETRPAPVVRSAPAPAQRSAPAPRTAPAPRSQRPAPHPTPAPHNEEKR